MASSTDSSPSCAKADSDRANIPAYFADTREKIYYSPTYSDHEYEYRHVILPDGRDLLDFRRSLLGKHERLLSEIEWRALGLQMSPGWEHYGNYDPEPEIMLFRRKINVEQNQ